MDQVYRGPLFLRGFDDDIRNALADSMRQQGVNLLFNTTIKSVTKNDDGYLVVFDNGEAKTYDAILSAIGRRPMTDNLGLESLSIATNSSGTIQINDRFETSAKGVYALGDVVGRMALTPVALEEGMALAKHLYANEPITLDYENIATAVFSQPEIATVGLTLEEAKAKGLDAVEFKSQFKPLKHTISTMDVRSLMKLVVEKKTEKILGCHMMGAHAGEIIQGLAIAIGMGATKSDFDKTVGVHPTSAEEFVTMR